MLTERRRACRTHVRFSRYSRVTYAVESYFVSRGQSVSHRLHSKQDRTQGKIVIKLILIIVHITINVTIASTSRGLRPFVAVDDIKCLNGHVSWHSTLSYLARQIMLAIKLLLQKIIRGSLYMEVITYKMSCGNHSS
jgi:hypothetical protein